MGKRRKYYCKDCKEIIFNKLTHAIYCLECAKRRRNESLERSSRRAQEIKHLKKTGIPRCLICEKNWVNAYDTIEKKKSKYLWEPSCKCLNKKIQVCIG